MSTPSAQELRETASNLRKYADTGNDSFVSAEDCVIAAAVLIAKADEMDDASVDFEGFDEHEGAAISQKTIDNPTQQNIYDYGKAVWMAAIQHRDRWHHKTVASLQAQLDAANARVAELEALYTKPIDIKEAQRLYDEATPDESFDPEKCMDAVRLAIRVDRLQAALAAMQSDCVTLANEVRRCWDLAQVGHDAEWDEHCGQCDDVIDKRSPEVVAAMEKYAGG